MTTALPWNKPVRRVLMTTDAVGGVWTYALDLARGLAAEGVETHLAVLGPALRADQRIQASSPYLTLYELGGRLEWMDDPWMDVALAGEALLDLETELQPDIVHLNGYAHGALPFQAPTIVVGHSCVCSWWQAVKREDAPASWDSYRHNVRRGLQGATAVVAPSHAMARALLDHYGPLDGPVRVLPNGRTVERYAPGGKERFVLTAGRIWDEAKNIAALDAIATNLSAPVYVAGDEGVGEAATNDRLVEGAKRLGRLSEARLAEWLSRASIYAMPARYEPFGLSVLEAGLSECALVLGDIDSLRENWEGAALFVPPDKPEVLQEVLNGLLQSEKDRRSWGVLARERAQSLPCERRMASAYAELYQECRSLRTTETLGKETKKQLCVS